MPPIRHGGASVRLHEFATATIAVAISPFPTLGMLTFDAVQGAAGLGTPRRLKRVIRSHLRRRDVEALGPFRGRASLPASLIGERVAAPLGLARILCGDPRPVITTLDEELDAVIAIDPGALLEAVEDCARESASADWRAVFADPSGWLRAYATALRRAWRGVEPLWRRSTPSIHRAAARIEAAVGLGAAAETISALHRRSTIADGRWWIPADRASSEYRLAPRFTVCPMIADPIATALFSDGGGTPTTLFYPAPDAWRAFDDDLPPPRALEALLGRQRLKILERLDVPRTTGQIAASLHLAPATATHQLLRLEGAGLVLRERRGRRVVVERTARGTALLELYRGP